MRRILPLLSLFLVAGCSTTGAVLSADDGGTSCSGPECCSTNKQCQDRNRSESFICRKTDHVCVNLLSTDCPYAFAGSGDLANDDAVIIGHIGMPSAAKVMADEENAVEVARRDLVAAAQGLPPTTADGSPRPLAIIACDTALHGLDAEHESAIRAAKHLAEDVRVPAILTATVDSTAVDIAQTVTIANGVTTIATVTTVPALSLLNDDDLVWRMVATDVQAVRILPILVERLEARVTTMRSPPVRVAMLTESGTPAELLEAIRQTVKVNAKSLAENGANVASFDVTGVGRENSAAPATVLAALIAFQPAIILYALEGTPKVVNQTVAAIESQWPEPVPRPLHVGTRTGWAGALNTSIGKNLSIRDRTYAISTEPPEPGDGSDQLVFEDRLRAAFPKSGFTSRIIAGHTYDATLLIALASAASNGRPLTGKAIADGLRRVGPGALTYRPLGRPHDLAAAFVALANGGTVDYRGVDGQIAFDRVGDRRVDAVLFCTRSPYADGLDKSRLRINGITDVLEGYFDCD